MRFSMIVTTLGRLDDLFILFRSLAAQTCQDFEVVIVDQNPDDKLAPLLAEFDGRFAIRHLHTKRPGLTRGRNAGIDAAGGEIINLTDDDCELPHDFLTKVDRLFRDQSDMDGLTTNTHAKDRPREMGRWDAGAMTLDRISVMDRCAEFTTYLRRASVGEVRYDEAWGLGAGSPWGADEGPDYLIRLMERGNRIVFFPNLVVYHPEKSRTITRSMLRRSFYYSRGRGHFYRMHHYPARLVANSLVRSMGGVVVSAAKLDGRRAAYYGLSLAGKVRGLLDPRRRVAAV